MTIENNNKNDKFISYLLDTKDNFYNYVILLWKFQIAKIYNLVFIKSFEKIFN